ncbi:MULTISPECIES: glycerophosphoryl diester phosphodiesterase membrane domain-containing protein [unclassified Lactococcus]|uniref:glycerophosphoryl diester phosphodiesterase membrane domain-containing protein n=1 Tax=unclassified Lactococcus TaxID=2643510 RepID=UPI0011CABBA5|nr:MULTISPECIES: glycerophosphodiester phosphodiesterase [unclassified Lactococcus]MQW22655.1 glycerophosphodiester phosphodiesterase [Lactococcus sp. dk101]TXK45672.1 glycerophosphodiester phosphodiesterase [Lactococcus sp. dk310]TXK51524.1 glycerophosphodiester phosphodiesterase [Lactococcus sp. dk322]
MKSLKTNLLQTYHFLTGAKYYYRDILLLHGFILFFLTPLLSALTRLILNQAEISYLSHDNLPTILQHHPFILIGLILMLLLLVLAVYFEFTFLLLTVYFIEQKQKINLRQLLRGSLLQIKKIKAGSLLFFLFYFLLILPFIGMNFNSALLAKFQVPAFILDVIFDHNTLLLVLFIAVTIFLIYLAVRFIFVLPELILKDQKLGIAIRTSWQRTQHHLLKIFIRYFVVVAALALLLSVFQGILLFIQRLFETYLPQDDLTSAIVIMTLLQVLWLLDIVLSTVSIFYISIAEMKAQDALPTSLNWLPIESQKTTAQSKFKSKSFLILVLVLCVLGLSAKSNADFLTDASNTIPATASHRGVDNKNAVQNSIEALKLTSQETHPDYVEMDIQETKDHQFVVFHDYNLKALTGIDKKPNQLTLSELTKITVKENGKTARIVSFDDYYKTAQSLNQRLLIEIKPTKDDSPEMLDNFIAKYGDAIEKHGDLVQSLSYDVIEQLKTKAPHLVAGYIMPFSVVGPPKGKMDFLTIEYTTLNAKFIKSAHAQGKKVFTWTPNDAKTMSRMMFYGTDGIITDQMELLNDTIYSNEEMTYSDKLIFFVTGIG